MDHPYYLRSLQRNTADGRESAVTVVYLIVLGACFVIPFCYYVRIRRSEVQIRRQRQQELAAMENSVNEPTREETRAARKKLREEKRARILQLFGPVSVVSTVDLVYRPVYR